MECSHCRFKNPEGMNFCGKCGQPLSGGSPPTPPGYTNRSPREYTPPFLLEKILVDSGALAGERKHVSVFFADVAGFTTLSENLDPEEVHDIMDGCFEILGQEIHGVGGAINQYTGDGVMALFGAPVAYEDHINRACHAALRIRDRLKAYTRNVKDRFGVLFQMRIGINAGTVVVAAIGDNLRLDYTAIGDTTNLAARLEAQAPPGGILVSRPIKTAAQAFFKFHKEGDFNIKGKKAPVPVFALLEEMDTMPFRETGKAGLPFVNRNKELTALKRSHETASKGQFRIAVVEGEAGVGKSRLLAAFQTSIETQKTIFLKGRCRPYGETTVLYPVAQMFRNYFGIGEYDGLAIIKKKIKRKIKQQNLIARSEKIFELFGAIRKEDAAGALFEGEKRRMFRALRDLLGGIPASSPLLLLFDDMQWVDQTTLDFLSFLARTPIKGPLLVVASGRTAPHPWQPEAPDDFIHLDPLEDAAALELFYALMGTRRLDDGVSQEIISQSGGNPLFLIEMAETIKKQNLLMCDGRICRLRLDVDTLKIPRTIRDVLAARLDALPGSVKQLAQVAAVIGREFSRHLLTRLLGDTDRLKQRLELLKKEGIIDGISSELGGKYVFHHQLMQEVAYHELLKKNRRRYHLMVGEAMEKMHRNNLSGQTGFLSYHFYRAENRRKALAYTLEAGDLARRSFACDEALMCFDRALDILRKGEWQHPREQALQIYKWKGGMHFCLGQMNQSHETFRKMLAEARQLRDGEAEGEALFRLGWTSFFQHQPVQALTFLRSAIDLAETNDLSEILLKAASFQGFVFSVLGDLKKAKPLLIQSLDLSTDSTGMEGKAWCLSYLIQYYNWTGELKEALAVCHELWRLNESLKSPFFHIVLHFRKGLIEGALGNLEEAEAVLQAGLKQLESGDERLWKPRFLNTLGWIRSEAGNYEGALALNRESLRLARPTDDLETIHNAEINVGENYLGLGEFKKADAVLYSVMRQIKNKRHLYSGWRYKNRLLIALAELHARTDEHEKALYFVNRALKATRKNGAVKHEALALTVKAGLVKQTRPKMARAYLERAHQLSTKMGARRLSQRISEDK